MKKVLVTGANGFVGSNLCKELINHSYIVRAMHREGSDSNLEDLKVEKVAADLLDITSLEKAMEGVEIVFHIAALFRQAKNPDSVYYDINVTGVKNVFEAAIKSGVKKIIHCSTVGVHSHIPNPPADEDEDYRPGDIYQETKCEGEKLALSYFKSGKIAGAIVRPAMIWGPGDERTLKLFKGIAAKTMPLISGNTFVHWILVTDLAKAFRLAAEKDLSAGEIFIIAGKEAVPIRRLFSVIAKTFNTLPPRFALPAWPFQMLGSLCEIICKPFGIEPPIYRRRVDFFTKTRWFDSTKANKMLGFQPENSFEDEVKLIAKWYKDKGWIE